MALLDCLKNVAESRVGLITTRRNAAYNKGSANFLTNVGILLKIGFHLGDSHEIIKDFVGLRIDESISWHTTYLVSC